MEKSSIWSLKIYQVCGEFDNLLKPSGRFRLLIDHQLAVKKEFWLWRNARLGYSSILKLIADCRKWIHLSLSSQATFSH